MRPWHLDPEIERFSVGAGGFKSFRVIGVAL